MSELPNGTWIPDGPRSVTGSGSFKTEPVKPLHHTVPTSLEPQDLSCREWFEFLSQNFKVNLKLSIGDSVLIDFLTCVLLRLNLRVKKPILVFFVPSIGNTPKRVGPITDTQVCLSPFEGDLQMFFTGRVRVKLKWIRRQTIGPSFV